MTWWQAAMLIQATLWMGCSAYCAWLFLRLRGPWWIGLGLFSGGFLLLAFSRLLPLWMDLGQTLLESGLLAAQTALSFLATVLLFGGVRETCRRVERNIQSRGPKRLRELRKLTAELAGRPK